MITRRPPPSIWYFISALIYLNHQRASASPSITTEQLIDSNESSHNKFSASTLPCPEPSDILPCVCQSEDFDMTIDCSNVSSTDELRNIFSQKFPFNEFHTLKIHRNDNLQVLCSDCFGEASFKYVDIYISVINIIELNVFHNSYSTLQQLSVEHSRITEFPFAEIEKFIVMKELDLIGNQLDTIDQFNSTALEDLYFNENKHIKHITFDSFHYLPNVQSIGLVDCSIQSIHPYTFTEMPKLRILNLAGNNLTEIPDESIKLNPEDLTFLYIWGNSISNVSSRAISGEPDGLHFGGNNLQMIEEETWRPLFKETKWVFISGNPLMCGCDIAWLILNEDFMKKLQDYPACYDGELLQDLDPAMYEHLC